MKKKITVIIICIFLVGICLYLLFPRTLKGKIKTNNGMSIVKNTPLVIVNDELATTDIKMKKASIEADDKELREVIDILLSVKYYKGFNIIDGKSNEIGKFSLLIYDGKDMINITEHGKISINSKIFNVYGGSKKVRELSSKIEKRIDFKSNDDE